MEFDHWNEKTGIIRTYIYFAYYIIYKQSKHEPESTSCANKRSVFNWNPWESTGIH